MGNVINATGHRGITLIELLFALALLALLAALSVPGFRTTMRNAAVRGAAFELLAGLQQTRAQAILESRTAELCPADMSGTCLPSSAAASAWRAYVQGGTPESAVTQELPRGIVVRSTRSPLIFRPQGLAASPGTLTICDLEAVATPRAIIVSQTGRARLADAPRGACEA